MMKKIAAVCVIGLFLSTAAVFAEHPDGLGVGIEFGGATSGFGPALTLKVPQLPIFWAVNLDLGGNSIGLGVSGDYYIFDDTLVGSINLGWYLGVGGVVGLWGFGDKLGFGVGVRVPVGLSWQFLKSWELFAEVAPQIGFQLLPTVSLWNSFWRGALGVRYWF
jgi:hypothetical protein